MMALCIGSKTILSSAKNCLIVGQVKPAIGIECQAATKFRTSAFSPRTCNIRWGKASALARRRMVRGGRSEITPFVVQIDKFGGVDAGDLHIAKLCWAAHFLRKQKHTAPNISISRAFFYQIQ